MLKRSIYILLFISILFPYENRWATTRFEHWWNENFNSMLYREPFSFIPYKIKIGKFYYGGNDFWSQVDLNQSFDLGTSPFTTTNENDFNYINDLKYREGIDLEIDFLGYNFFKNTQNFLDIVSGFGYKFSRPLSKAPVDNWFDDNGEYYYYPVAGTFKFNITFMVQRFEKFSPYLNYSYGLTQMSLFKNSDGDKIIKTSGISESLELGFNIVKQLQNKNYNLLYGFELGFNESQIDDIEDVSSKLSIINTQDIAIRFTIGVAYGGNKTVGDQGFNYLVNSDYIDVIDSFNKFKIKYPKHPKIHLANTMIEFSKNQAAYDMLYNGIDSYQSNDINAAIDWYNQALIAAKDSSLIYEIQSRQYIIADYLYSNIDAKIAYLSINESLDYIEYIEGISSKIVRNLRDRKMTLLYKKADVFLEAKNYISAFNIYSDNRVLYPEDLYVYAGRINGLMKMLIDDTNSALIEKRYILAYENMKLLNMMYPGNIDYLEDNINALKESLETQYLSRINENTQTLITQFKRQYRPDSQNLVLSIGDTSEKVKEFLGRPIKITDRINNNSYYTMMLYKIGNKNYRLFFEGNILFDLEAVE